MTKLQHEFSQSANSLMDHPSSSAMINAKVTSLNVPEDFKGNPQEFRRRSEEGLRRLIGDEYMLALQNGKRFNLSEMLKTLPAHETPNSLNNRAAIIENRVITAGEKPNPAQRLRNASMDTQQAFLEQAATAIRDESIKTGSVSANGTINDFAKSSYARGLTPADVANYAMLTEGVNIPKDTLDKVAVITKPVADAGPEPSKRSVAIEPMQQPAR